MLSGRRGGKKQMRGSLLLSIQQQQQKIVEFRLSLRNSPIVNSRENKRLAEKQNKKEGKRSPACARSWAHMVPDEKEERAR